MRQVSVRISTYTADVSGVCSALYELGGMVVIHDPSGCNSTYNTHDEPRWYEQDSLVFISGLSEIDAIMGSDEKLVKDIVRAARDLSPGFIALVRTPVPMMTGMDLEAAKVRVAKETGIPVFYFATTGMSSYIQGAGEALAAVARHMVKEKNQDEYGVNLLGATPLDFSINETIPSLKQYLREQGCPVLSCLAMGNTAEEISEAGRALVNLVISSAGLKAAKALRERFGTPYVVGMPTGKFKDHVMKQLRLSGEDKVSRIAYCPAPSDCGENVYLIGETVISRSLREAIWMEYGIEAKVICPLETDPELLDEACLTLESEEEIQKELGKAAVVIADPLYRPICREDALFIPLPHEAFSGRIYRRQIPDLTEIHFLDQYLLSGDAALRPHFRASSAGTPHFHSNSPGGCGAAKEQEDAHEGGR